MSLLSERPKRRKEDESAAAPPRAESKGVQYHCDYCRADITHVVRIKCAVCKNFDLCVECFAKGVEVAGLVNHRADHAYRVMDRATEPIFDEEWGADEELLLLEAIEMYGFGNWADIAEHVGGNKSKTKCETHYTFTYLGVGGALPLCKTGGLKRKATDPVSTASSDEGSRVVKSEPNESSSSSSSTSTSAMQMPASPPLQPLQLHGVGNSVGYLPHRGDFETEWENEAETVLADMEFCAEDAPSERDLKLRLLRNYNARLDQREERKAFIVERGLLFPREKKRSKEERDVFNALKVFARFHTAEEHEAFVKGLVNEQRLRRRIEQLQAYRLQGVRTLAEADRLDADRKRREADAQRRQVDGLDGPSVSLGSSSGAGANSSSSSSSSSSASGSGTAGRATARSRQVMEDSLFASDGSRVSAAMQAKTRTKVGAVGSGSGSGASSSSSSSSSLATPLDISGMDQYDLLSSGERTLCSELRLIPRHYLIIKRALLEESFRRGYLRKGSARSMIAIDVHRVDKVFEFFVRAGWVNEIEAEMTTPSL